MRFLKKHQDIVIAVTLALLLSILGSMRMVPGVCGNFHDDGIYAITAKALAQGQGYRLIYLPGAPLQTKYPILFPGLLALVWKIWPAFPQNLLLMKWLTLLCGAAALGLCYFYLTRCGYFPRSYAASGGLVCATSPMFLYYATQVLSEIPFLLLVIVALWAFDGQRDETTQKGTRQFLLGILLALPFLCRSIGVTLALAGLLMQFWRGRRLRWMALGMAMVMAPWFIWMAAGLGAWNRDPLSGYYTDYFGWWAATGWTLALRIVSENIINILASSAIVTIEALSLIPDSTYTMIKIIPFVFIGSIPLIAIISDLRTLRLLPVFLVSYLLLILVWPWHPMRFMAPLILFWLAYFFRELGALFSRWKLETRHWLPLALGIMLVANLGLFYEHIQRSNEFGYPFLSLKQKTVYWSSYQEIFHWLETNSQPDAIIASWEDPMIYLYSGRRAIRPCKFTPGFFGYGKDLELFGSAKELLQTLKNYHIRYLVKVPINAIDEDRIYSVVTDLQNQYPGLLMQVYAGQDKRFAIYEVIQAN
jgi:hypothetical protein